eukprot:scaffold142493_cov112-Phaeocystis_antarctica.AAC.3
MAASEHEREARASEDREAEDTRREHERAHLAKATGAEPSKAEGEDAEQGGGDEQRLGDDGSRQVVEQDTRVVGFVQSEDRHILIRQLLVRREQARHRHRAQKDEAKAVCGEDGHERNAGPVLGEGKPDHSRDRRDRNVRRSG